MDYVHAGENKRWDVFEILLNGLIPHSHFGVLPLFALDKEAQAWHRQDNEEVVKGPRQFEIAQYTKQEPLCLHYLAVWSQENRRIKIFYTFLFRIQKILCSCNDLVQCQNTQKSVLFVFWKQHFTDPVSPHISATDISVRSVPRI